MIELDLLAWLRALLHPTPAPVPLHYDAPTALWSRTW